MVLMLGSARITPAHAGKSQMCCCPCDSYGDHPRTRGEKHRKMCQSLMTRGSPPHTRGKVEVLPKTDSAYRITPAHAGKSSVSWLGKPEPEDHPRTRGEKSGFPSHDTESTGSPPHTRGKVFVCHFRFGCFGITPAHAGKRLNKPPYYGHSSAAGHRISFNFPMSSYVSRQSVKALCAPRISIPKYSQSAVSVY